MPTRETSRQPDTLQADQSVQSSSEALDINERLRQYRANKALQKQTNGTSATTRGSSRPGQPSNGRKDLLRSTADRPVIPERVAASSARGRTARDADTSATKSVGRSTPTKRRKGEETAAASVSVSMGESVRPTAYQDEDELELLECLYWQLCFTEAKAAYAFREQEKKAEKQLWSAWGMLQGKLQLLHETSMRLDREVHTYRVENQLADQAEPFIRLASRINQFSEQLSAVCKSLENSLHRMPTPGATANPLELKRELDTISVAAEGFLAQLQSNGLGSSISKSAAFASGMEESTEQVCSLLLQVGNLLVELMEEVNTETSLAVHRIQEQRVESIFKSGKLF
ncbi:hypothetical protein PINS_up001629 [Pythium insidiosum]|nr:hypothetical protein PINS_up001629 [Pythium insidiosum]